VLTDITAEEANFILNSLHTAIRGRMLVDESRAAVGRPTVNGERIAVLRTLQVKMRRVYDTERDDPPGEPGSSFATADSTGVSDV
jgi:hypothetical protein